MRVRNYSERTINSYLSTLTSMSCFFNSSPEKLSSDQVKEYAYHLIHEKKLSPATINQLISAWKILQVDILKKDWEEIYLKRPRIERKLPHVLSQSEAHALVNTPINLKHKTIWLSTLEGLNAYEVLRSLTGVDPTLCPACKIGKMHWGKGIVQKE